MEPQYFESNPNKNSNILLTILMAVGIIFLSALVVYAFFAIQKVSKEAKYVGVGVTQNNTINISETGVVYVVPDMANVTFTTLSNDANISEALKLDSNSSNSIIDFLKRQGIDDADIQTVDFNVYPQYQWQTKGIDLSVYPLGKRVITGYQVTHSIRTVIRSIDQAGNIIQGAVVAGASQVSELTLINSNLDDLRQQARDLAISQAKTKASAIASGLGVTLGNPVSFTESFIVPVSYQSSTTGAGANLQISVGENKIQATVNISYEIK